MASVATSPRFTDAAQKNCERGREQKDNETDSPDSRDRRDLDYGQTIHLRVSKIAERAVRRSDRDQVFVGREVEWKRKRREEDRTASQKTAHKQDAEPEEPAAIANDTTMSGTGSWIP